MINIMLHLVCGPVLLVGFNDPITKIDRQVMTRAEYVCKTQYKKCVQKIIKKEELVYNVICGRSIKND